jgi:hypothetical protein
MEIEREESLREGETEKERSRVREFERESWELGETPSVGAERRSDEPVTQIQRTRDPDRRTRDPDLANP